MDLECAKMAYFTDENVRLLPAVLAPQIDASVENAAPTRSFFVISGIRPL